MSCPGELIVKVVVYSPILVLEKEDFSHIPVFPGQDESVPTMGLQTLIEKV